MCFVLYIYINKTLTSLLHLTLTHATKVPYHAHKMDFYSQNGSYFVRDADRVYALFCNVLNLWAVDADADTSAFDSATAQRLDNVFEQHTLGEVELTDQVFVHAHDHRVVADIMLTDDEDEYVEEFTIGDEENDETIADFHRASRAFDQWQPDTAAAHVFKNMVTEMEKKHKK